MRSRLFDIPSYLCLPIVFILLLIALVPTFGRTRASRLAATYEHGSLSLAIPYESTHEGSGRLEVKLLDPEDQVLGRVEHTIEIAKGDGTWQQTITPEKPVPLEDVVWQRISYRFTYSDHQIPAIEGIESKSGGSSPVRRISSSQSLS